MNEQASAFFSAVKNRMGEISDVALTLTDALMEDMRENAEMFDRTRLDFSKNLHKNTTMRSLKKTLEEKDTDFLYLLHALLETGMEISLGLASYPTPMAKIEAAERVFREEKAGTVSREALVNALTEPKSQHLARFLEEALKDLEWVETE